MRAFSRFALLVMFVSLISSTAFPTPTPYPEPKSAKKLFKNRPWGPRPKPTPAPSSRRRSEEREPFPAGWRRGLIAGATLLTFVILYRAARALRSANLFDRQYRFPKSTEAAFRFGATRSGGHMATIHFGPDPPSKTEDT